MWRSSCQLCTLTENAVSVDWPCTKPEVWEKCVARCIRSIRRRKDRSDMRVHPRNSASTCPPCNRTLWPPSPTQTPVPPCTWLQVALPMTQPRSTQAAHRHRPAHRIPAGQGWWARFSAECLGTSTKRRWVLLSRLIILDATVSLKANDSLQTDGFGLSCCEWFPPDRPSQPIPVNTYIQLVAILVIQSTILLILRRFVFANFSIYSAGAMSRTWAVSRTYGSWS